MPSFQVNQEKWMAESLHVFHQDLDGPDRIDGVENNADGATLVATPMRNGLLEEQEQGPEKEVSKETVQNKQTDMFQTPRRASDEKAVSFTESLRLGCRRRLFEEGFAEHIPKPVVSEMEKTLEEGLDAGFNIGVRLELLRHSVKSLRLLSSLPCLRNDLRRMGLLRQFCAGLTQAESWLGLKVHAVGEINDRLCWALREFIHLYQVFGQGGSLVKLVPSEVFSKNLWTEHLGLQEFEDERGKNSHHSSPQSSLLRSRERVRSESVSEEDVE